MAPDWDCDCEYRGGPLPEWLDNLTANLGRVRFNRGSELLLQRDLYIALGGFAVTCLREHILDCGLRLDHWLPASRVACECKIHDSYSKLLGQVGRYLEQPEVAGVLVVTAKHAHTRLPTVLHKKPLRVLWVAANW